MVCILPKPEYGGHSTSCLLSAHRFLPSGSRALGEKGHGEFSIS